MSRKKIDEFSMVQFKLFYHDVSTGDLGVKVKRFRTKKDALSYGKSVWGDNFRTAQKLALT